MKTDHVEETGKLIMFALVFMLGMILGACIRDNALKKDAIRKGTAIYNPTNGAFQWKN